MPRTHALLLLIALSCSILPVPLRAEEMADNDVYRHVRTTDHRLRQLLRRGVHASLTFRGLVERLRRSDVVVYLECDGRSRHGGRLRFVSAVGGRRYVQVRVARLAQIERQIAIIGHELRHAVEIADAPEVVDEPSLAQAYERIGFINPRAKVAGVAFDSTAAVDAGRQVLRELVDERDARFVVARY